MISPKDFRKGQLACLVSYQRRQPVIIEVRVSKVGRKYVYNGRTPFETAEYADNWLVEHSEYGGSGDLLFLNRKDAEEWVEKQELERWVKEAVGRRGHTYTLEQLRKMKEILENENG